MSQGKVIDKTRLTDSEWVVILSQLKKTPRIYIGGEVQCRRFVEAVLWILRVGGQWRSLPAERGNWNSVFKRFAHWSSLNVWNQLLELLAKNADLQSAAIDSTVIRAHACAAGAAFSNEENEALGRSRGGFGCKIHAVVDGLGLPLKFILTGGQKADITQAIPLMTDTPVKICLADKGYDADAFLTWLNERGILAVIPPKSNRIMQRECDWWLYKERHVVECMFGKLKYYRRIATRYDKKSINFMGFLAFAAALLWLR